MPISFETGARFPLRINRSADLRSGAKLDDSSPEAGPEAGTPIGGPLAFSRSRGLARVNRHWFQLLASLVVTIGLGAGEMSLQERINLAGEGDTVIVESGEHRGNLVLERPITLRGIDQPVIHGDGTTHVIQIRAPHVTVEGFRIRGSGVNLSADHAGIHVMGDQAVIRGNRITRSLHGVYVRAASHVKIENNVIRSMDPSEADNPPDELSAFGAGELCASSLAQDRRGNGIHFWNSKGNVVSGNEISETRDGIYFSFTNETRVENNRIFKARYGLHYMYSHHNHFANNRFFENVAGAALMYSKEIVMRDNQFTGHRGPRAYGLVLQSVDRSVLENNLLQGNTTGLYVQNSYGNLARRNHFTQNYVGIRFTSSSMDNRFSGNLIADNLHNLALAGRSVGNDWSESGQGNHWKGAVALDLNGDGVSAVAHREVDLFGPLRKEFPYVAFLSGSPGMKVLQSALQRAPLPNTPFISDPHPLTVAPRGAQIANGRNLRDSSAVSSGPAAVARNVWSAAADRDDTAALREIRAALLTTSPTTRP